MLRSLPIFVVLLTPACTAQLDSSTAPSPTQIVVDPARTGNATYTLSGRVTKSKPTTSDGIAGATLRISDGVSAGRFTATDARGFYTLPNLPPSEFSLRVSAPGYVASSERVTVAYDRTANVQLRPEPEQLSYSMRGDIASEDGQCSDGEAMRSCRLILFPVHNPGTIQATLRWTTTTDVDLDLTLFETGALTPIARGPNMGEQVEQLRGDVAGGTTYELRITLRAGTGAASYALDFSQPN